MCYELISKQPRDVSVLSHAVKITKTFLCTNDTARNAWLSFQQTFFSCDTLREIVCFRHQSISHRDHFQDQDGSHQSKHYNVVLHTGCSILHDTCSHCKCPICLTSLSLGKQSVESNNVHISAPYFSCSTLSGMPNTGMKKTVSKYENYNKVSTLKGLCHEDFAILGQFCSKIITLRL